VLELMGVTYGPCLVPGSDASTEASNKRKTDSVGKAVAKCPKAPKKKRAKSVKTSTLRGKMSLKQSSNAEVSSAKPVKLSKNIMPRAVATVVVARGMLGASGPKSVVGALGSKIIGGTSSSKPAVVQKKNLRACQETLCSHDWSYGGGIFRRVLGVFATWSDDRGLNTPNCPEAGALGSIFASVIV
jgi:hypothetical protein